MLVDLATRKDDRAAVRLEVGNAEGVAGNLLLTKVKSGYRCRCGHPYVAHQHYRSGSECSQCPDCPRYRSASGIIKRIIDRLTKFRHRLKSLTQPAATSLSSVAAATRARMRSSWLRQVRSPAER